MAKKVGFPTADEGTMRHFACAVKRKKEVAWGSAPLLGAVDAI